MIWRLLLIVLEFLALLLLFAEPDRLMVSVRTELPELRLIVPLLPVRLEFVITVFSFVAVLPGSTRLVVVDFPEFAAGTDRLIVLSALLFFEISGRYRLTERLLTVDLPGREAFVT